MKLSKLMMSAVCLIGVQLSALSAGEGWKDCSSPCHQTRAPRCFDIDSCDVQYHLYADFLYWDVQKSDLALGRDAANELQYLNPEYDFGYRVGATAAWHNWDLGLKYTWLRNRTTGDIPDPVNDFEARFKFNLDVLDIEVGHTFCLNCGPVIFRPFVGAKLAWIDDRFDTRTVGNGFNNHIDFKGYGLYLGASGRWELCSYQMCDYNLPISLVMRGSTGILRSQFKQNVTNFAGAHSDLARQDAYIPVHEAYVGLDFAINGMCNNEISLQVGYEAQYWGWRGYSDFFGVDANDTSHLGMGGLVVRGGVSF